MKFFRLLTIVIGLASCLTMNAQSDLTPSIIFPETEKSSIFTGISDNGKYAVIGSVGDPYNNHAAILYEISDNGIRIGDLNEANSGTWAIDVTDDGNIVVGSRNSAPHIWRNQTGWTKLPLPAGYYYGFATAVTPDGKYAVGRIQKDPDGLEAEGCLWDLTTNEIIEVPANKDVIDFTGVNQDQNWYTQISADGRYIFGTVSFSYPTDTRLYVIDRDKDRVIYIDADDTGRERIPGLSVWETDINAKALSSNGKWVAGTVDDTITGEDLAFYFDVENEQLYVTNGKNETNSWAWSITNSGTPLCTRPALSLYGECSIYYDNRYIPLADILEGVYGMNLGRHGIDNTGKPVLVSDDGRTIVLITSYYDSYILKLKEDIEDACKKVDLLKKWTASPKDGSFLPRIDNVQIAFSQYIQTSETDYNKVQLLDSNGNVVANPLANGGLTTANNVLTITFPTLELEEQHYYTLVVPAGIVWVDGDESSKNSDINIRYIGRLDTPATVTEISPNAGDRVSMLDGSESPIILTYDRSVMLNEKADTALGSLYLLDGDKERYISPIMFKPHNYMQLAAYPPQAQKLYMGSTYKVVIPEGIAVDLLRECPSEKLEIIYEGSYIPILGDDQYLFNSRCNDFSNFLLYDGDQGLPTEEYEWLGFTYDTTPWTVLQRDFTRTDLFFGSHSCYTDGRQADDWVATHQIRIPEDEKVFLTFDTRSNSKEKEDYLKVYVYDYDGTINSLDKTVTDNIRKEGDLIFNERLNPDEWETQIISLEAYKGKNIMIAFVNENQNQSMVLIDNVKVVRNVQSLLTLLNNSNVVNQESIVIKGLINGVSAVVDFQGISMTLKDEDGNVVSTISDPDVVLSVGEPYNFEFPQALPLTLGEENPFTIEYTVGNESTVYSGVIRDLTFEPVKRVVIEEFTDTGWGECAGGIATLQRLENIYGEQLIPIEIHGYDYYLEGTNGSDYARYLNFNLPPQAIINRRGRIAAPIYYSNEQQRYVGSVSNLYESEADAIQYPFWQDEIADELKEPALMDISVHAVGANANAINYEATIKSALNLTDQNIRIFGVLLQDGLEGHHQVNAYYQTDDELLGDWGLNGKYNQNIVSNYTLNNVARSIWGNSYNGTGGLLPTNISSSETYSVDMNVPLPEGFIYHPSNLKFVVILIDENTGRVINSYVIRNDETDLYKNFYITGSDINGNESYELNSQSNFIQKDNGIYEWSGEKLGGDFKIENAYGKTAIGSNGEAVRLGVPYAYVKSTEVEPLQLADTNGEELNYIINPTIVLNENDNTITVTGMRQMEDISINNIVYSYSYENDYWTVKDGTNAAGEVSLIEKIQDKPLGAISKNAFVNNTKLTSISIPEGLKIIDENAFIGCRYLKNVSLPNSLIEISNNAFSGCRSLTTITLHENLSILGEGAFEDCNALTSVIVDNSKIPVIPNSCFKNTGLKEWDFSQVQVIEYSAFEGTNLEEADLSQTGISTIGSRVFAGCKKLARVKLPETLRAISIGCFENCESLVFVELPENVMRIGETAFEGCINLRSVVLPPSILSIGLRAFANSGLIWVTIPSEVSDIEYETFQGCKDLLFVNLPSNLQHIGDRAFNSPSIIAISSPAQVPPTTGYMPFEGVDNNVCSLAIPQFSFNSYVAAEYWKSFVNINDNITFNIDADANITYIDETEYQRLLDESKSDETLRKMLSFRNEDTFSSSLNFAQLFDGAHVSITNNRQLRIFFNDDYDNYDIEYNGKMINDEIDAQTNSWLIPPVSGNINIRIKLKSSAVDDIIDSEWKGYSNVYDIDGRLLIKNATKEQINKLLPGIYIINGKKHYVTGR